MTDSAFRVSLRKQAVMRAAGRATRAVSHARRSTGRANGDGAFEHVPSSGGEGQGEGSDATSPVLTFTNWPLDSLGVEGIDAYVLLSEAKSIPAQSRWTAV